LRITSDLSLRHAEPGEHTVSDAKGLILRVHGTKDGDSSRSWIVRVADNGRRRRIGLGQYPTVTLARARALATDAHRAIAAGDDPSRTAKRRQRAAREERSLTLGRAINDYLEKAASRFKNPKSNEIRLRALRVLFAPLHSRAAAEVTTAEIADILRPLRPETASRAYTAIRAVFDYAEVVLRPLGVTVHNPTSSRSLAALGWKRKSRKTHIQHPAVNWRLMPEIVAEVAKLDGADAHCLRFIIATAVRSGSARLAKWSDIDLEMRVWRIPAHDLKDSEHRHYGTFDVPLNALALAALDAIRTKSKSGYIFATSVGAPITDRTITNITRRLRRRHDHWRDPQTGEPFTVHGLRATFKTWTREAGLDPKLFNHIPSREIAEIVLGHRIGSDVERAYDRSDLLEAKRTMLDLWASQCLGGKVIALRVRA
jgi:integrase